ncbi:MAG: hypothetical protein ACOH1V_07875 [Stenotrophomonas sp.]
MHTHSKAFFCCIFSILLASCSSKSEIEITAPLPTTSEQPTIEQAHQALTFAAQKTCPTGYTFDDSKIKYGAIQDGKPRTVAINIRCK